MIEKPNRITEEEISISKEKKICIICKGKVMGITYICPDCETIYCEKCYKALIHMENRCWVCDKIIDESQPAKSLKDTNEDNYVILGKNIKKQKNREKTSLKSNKNNPKQI